MSESQERYMTNGYYVTIGIECHVQLKTKTKLFAAVSNEARQAEPNTLVNHVCFGMPGALPVLNREAVRLASVAAYALETEPQRFSKFDRKHYFYPDLPKGYQISQFDQPIILGGNITITLEDGTEKNVHITRAHLEEDAGKSTHEADYSLVDLNRAGTPLLEIVSEPELFSAKEAKAYAKELWLRMKFAGVSDVDLYHGNMRFDVNVSVSKDLDTLGTRTETKNLNSFKSIERAVDYEVARQIELLEQGESIVQETRGWLDDKQKTFSQRSKEDAHDYRYFPDPDIPPVVLDESYVEAIQASLPVLVTTWRERLSALGLPTQIIESLLEAQAEDVGDVLSVVESGQKARAKTFANWVINIDVPFVKETGNVVSTEVRLRAYAGVAELVEASKLSSNNAKSLLEKLLASKDSVVDIEAFAEDNGLIQESDTGELSTIVEAVLAENPKPVEDVKNGEMKAIGFLVGQVMKASGGKANPAEAQKIIKQNLGL